MIENTTRGIRSSGSNTVDEMGKLNITGNILNLNWLKKITFENGKPNLKAAIVLSDIVYWYRPTEVRDEQTGCVIGYKKKFKADKLQRSYQDFANMFGISKREATNALDALVKLGVVEREFRCISVSGGKLPNVMFLDLNIEMLCKITFPEFYDNSENNGTEINHDIKVTSTNKGVTLKSNISHPDGKNNGGITLESDMYYIQKREGVTLESDTVSHSKGRGITLDGETNTKNTTENTTREYSINLSYENDGWMDVDKNVDNSDVIILFPNEMVAEDDINRVLYEMNKTIPYDYAIKKRQMKTVVQALVGWNYRKSLYETVDNSDQMIQTFELATECLIEMATDKEIRKYGQSHASYKNVIDQINKCWQENKDSNQPLEHFLTMAVERYIDAGKTREIPNGKMYLKSVIWNLFSTYRDDWNRYFNRTYSQLPYN